MTNDAKKVENLQLVKDGTEFIGWKGLRGTRHAPAGATLGTGVRPIPGCGEKDGHWAASQYIMMSRCRAEVAVARHQEVVIIMFSISRGGIVWYGYSYSMGMGRGNNNIYSDCTLSLAPVMEELRSATRRSLH